MIHLEKKYLFLFLILLSTQAFGQLQDSEIEDIIYVGTTRGADAHFLDYAISASIPVQDFTDTSAGYASAVAAADPKTTLIIVDRWGGQFYDHDGAGLPAFIENGGRVIFAAWSIARDFDSPLTRAALGIISLDDNRDAIHSIFDWGTVPGMFDGIPATGIDFNGNGFGITNNRFSMVTMNSTEVAGYVSTAFTAGETGIVLSNDQRTIILGICVGTSIDPSLGATLATNLVDSLLQEDTAIVVVPTLDQWGVIVLSIIMSIIGVVFLRQRKMQFASVKDQ